MKEGMVARRGMMDREGERSGEVGCCASREEVARTL